MANARATANGNIDTAMATIKTNLATSLAAGLSAGLFVRWINSQIAGVDPKLARVVQRNYGASRINATVPATLVATDVKP